MRARRLSRALSRIYSDELRPHGVTAAQLNLLVALGVAGALSPARLASALDLEKSTLSRNLRVMEGAGWVSVARDGAGQTVSLTEAGQTLLGDLRPAWDRAQARAQALLGDDIAQALLRIPT